MLMATTLVYNDCGRKAGPSPRTNAGLTTRLVLLCHEHGNASASDPAALITKTYRAIQEAGTETAAPLRLVMLKWKPLLKRKKNFAAG
jgi:hypothetical protein